MEEKTFSSTQGRKPIFGCLSLIVIIGALIGTPFLVAGFGDDVLRGIVWLAIVSVFLMVNGLMFRYSRRLTYIKKQYYYLRESKEDQ